MPTLDLLGDMILKPNFYTLMDKRADFTNYGQQLASEELPQLMLTCHALFM